MKLICETYASWRAEVVFITSNYQGNQEMMEGCKAAGIPAFVRHHSLVFFWRSLIRPGYFMGLLNPPAYTGARCLCRNQWSRTPSIDLLIFIMYSHPHEQIVSRFALVQNTPIIDMDPKNVNHLRPLLLFLDWRGLEDMFPVPLQFYLFRQTRQVWA
jgi:hypothetical protein